MHKPGIFRLIGGLKMSKQRAEYHIAPDNQTRAKTPPVSLTLNSEQVRGVIHCAAQKSPRLLVSILTSNACTHPLDLLSEEDAQIILRAIVKKYPNLAQKAIEHYG